MNWNKLTDAKIAKVHVDYEYSSKTDQTHDVYYRKVWFVLFNVFFLGINIEFDDAPSKYKRN